MFKNGLRQASEKTDDDSALYGSMLVENALEQMVRCPAAIKDIWLAMTAHVDQADGNRVYQPDKTANRCFDQLGFS